MHSNKVGIYKLFSLTASIINVAILDYVLKMSSSTNTLRTNEAVCLAVPPKNGQRKSGPTSEGEPRVGAFFFINHGVENGSLSSLSSALTMYTDAEIMENRTD